VFSRLRGVHCYYTSSARVTSTCIQYDFPYIPQPGRRRRFFPSSAPSCPAYLPFCFISPPKHDRPRRCELATRGICRVKGKEAGTSAEGEFQFKRHLSERQMDEVWTRRKQLCARHEPQRSCICLIISRTRPRYIAHSAHRTRTQRPALPLTP
jgi:hypothetical protein